jgi:hypothetical protein
MRKSTRTLLAFDETQQESIDQIKRALADNSGPEMSNREFFLLALGLGFESDVEVETFKRSNNGVRLEYFKEEDTMLMAAVHLHKSKNPESLLDIEAIYNSAETYAAGGVKLLVEALNQSQDLRIWLQARVKSAFEGLQSE